LGAYGLALNPRIRPAAKLFCAWLRSAAQAADAAAGLADSPPAELGAKRRAG
jgi:hypothetical protein